MVKGTKIGNWQRWRYHGAWNERKVAPQTWKGTFNATKHQRRKGRFPVGGKITWGITGKQYVVKTGNNRYQTRFKFRKRLLSKRIPRGRR